MSIIASEGYRERAKHDAPGFYCTHCKARTTLILANCPMCGNHATFAPVTTPEKYHDQTKAIKESEQVKNFSPGFDSTDRESQKGKMMTPDQLFTILRAAISGLQVKRGHNFHLGRDLYALYIPTYCKSEDEVHLSDAERRDKLQFVCGCEVAPMPEWDVVQKNDDGTPKGLIRGWRSVLGIFYRKKLIPWVPDDGRRLSAWTIRNSVQ